MPSREIDDPVLERRRLQALTQIRQFGDPVLRTPTLEITAFDETLRDDVERMGAIMRDAAGVGLAAPQVGSLRRLMVLRPDGDGPVIALCNPHIVWRSDEEDVAEEGCLSLGEIAVEVSRPVAIRVEAQDLAGKPLLLEPEGFAARVIQHEVDHLDGVLILDRTTPEQRREALRALRNGG
ncbi:MAG: peptide deformylase [Miltoncostaeaceae bacterium]|jgi:peptide deformylase|nr:peptide deformylase [Miltoncostaeaceae bacterium]